MNTKIIGTVACLAVFLGGMNGCTYSKSTPGGAPTGTPPDNSTTAAPAGSGQTGTSGSTGSTGASGSSGTSGTSSSGSPSGSLDSGFGSAGKATFAYANGSKTYDVIPGAIYLNPDGTFFVSGTATESVPNTVNNPFLFLARFKSDGNLDTSFAGANQGFVITTLNAKANSMSVDSSGRILVGGSTVYGVMMWGSQQPVLVRFLADGSMDTNFGDLVSGTRQGYAKGNGGDSFNSIAVLKDNSIFAAGERNPKVLWMCKQGTPCMVSFPDILVAHYTDQGEADKSFGANSSGYQTLDFKNQIDDAMAIAVDEANGKIYIGGSTMTRSSPELQSFLLAQLKMNGTPDSSFGSDPTTPGIAAYNFGSQTADMNALILEKDGHLVAAGSIQNPANNSKDFLVARFTTDGALDTTFNNQGYAMVDFGQKEDTAVSVVVLDDNRLVVGGTSMDTSSNLGDFALCRLAASGQPDTTFGTSGLATTDFGGTGDKFVAMSLQADGKVLAVGYSAANNQPTQAAFARYLP